MEIWKDIIWYEWLYKISNRWNIQSINRVIKNWKYSYKLKRRILKQSLDRDWYSKTNLCKLWKRKTVRVHRLVWLHFIQNNNKKEINHKDWNKTNNNVENLEWCNWSENKLHAYRELWRKSTKWYKYNMKKYSL